MRKLLFKNVILIVFLVLFASIGNVKGVYYAQDTVKLYENGERIYDSDTIVRNEKCENGICYIGQQFYPVTIYRARPGTLTGPQFTEQDPYPKPPTATGRMTNSEWQEALAKWSAVYDEWSKRTSADYIKYLEENSKYHILFNPGLSDDGIYDGRIGTPRSYAIDVATGEYKDISDTAVVWNNQDLRAFLMHSPSYMVIFAIVLLAVPISLLYLIRKRIKKNKYSS